MKIYTKGGDQGQTSLYDGQRVYKNSLQVETYGTFDELNSNISVADKFCVSKQNKRYLQHVEYLMFLLQGELASGTPEKYYQKSQVITNEDVKFLEKVIDRYSEKLPKVTSFILPGASQAGAQLHVCRTVCRRAERLLITYMENHEVRPEIERYVNRMSDFFYIIARDEDYEERINKIVAQVVAQYQKIMEEKSHD
ncbi:cob(I)yrinic acid a,c-diamide adenosyltransferase [Ligilactobacillus pobuzihii]|uniref:cob(I)yrinic acid a,c-diamide adenosyltransferase n=1 Tax=Ligilactobacillus pobuzihii TaxID=449659 RepID=UPI0019D0046A|nr:cob(I)yrinic acid a,c-diamide adenosyltransferase [Ligilactobacillus pobuzihii]MBN7273809.1 cob(I)yrinic acid a,c-diamide adenosyltransferase [Ligilactobacillus pobuzihii]